MSLPILLGVGIVLSIIFHFAGVYAGAKKTVWVMIVLMWAGSISIATSEIKPKGYQEIDKMKGKYSQTDKIIEEALPKVTVYELVLIRNSYNNNKPK